MVEAFEVAWSASDVVNLGFVTGDSSSQSLAEFLSRYWQWSGTAAWLMDPPSKFAAFAHPVGNGQAGGQVSNHKLLGSGDGSAVGNHGHSRRRRLTQADEPELDCLVFNPALDVEQFETFGAVPTEEGSSSTVPAASLWLKG